MSGFQALANYIHGESMRVQHRASTRTPVVVDSFDPQTFAVKLKLMPDSIDPQKPVLTGWIPLHTLQTGNQFGWYSPPNINDHGWLEFHDDDREAATFSQAVFNDVLKPIGTVQAGELNYIHSTLSSMYFNQNGQVIFTDKPTGTGNNKTWDSILMDGPNQAMTFDAPTSKTSNTKIDNYIKIDGKNRRFTLIVDDETNDTVHNEIIFDGVAKTFTLTTKLGQSVTFDNQGNVAVSATTGNVAVSSSTGNVSVATGTGNISIAPGSGSVFLGGTGSDGIYAAVQTTSGPSVNVSAKIG